MMNYAWSQGVVIVAAAGNSGLGSSGSPANCPNVISVASTTSSGALVVLELRHERRYGSARLQHSLHGPQRRLLQLQRRLDGLAVRGRAGRAGLLGQSRPHATVRGGRHPDDGHRDQRDRLAVRLGAHQRGWRGWQRRRWPGPHRDGRPDGHPDAHPNPDPDPRTRPHGEVVPAPPPPLVVTTTPAGSMAFDASMQAGVGVIRRVDFSQFRNATVTIGGYTNVSQPFTFNPPSYISQIGFRVTQQNGGQAATVTMTITDDCGPWTTLVGAGVGGFQRGAVSGTIRNAANNQPIDGVNIVVRGAQRSDQTDSNGAYTIADVPTGVRTLDISAAGFASQAIQVTVQANQTASINANLTATGSQQNIVVSLTWGASPGDLDIHLSGPTVSGNRFHLYWNNPSAVSHALLSPDQHNGYGPESVTIRRSSQTGNWVPGEYRIWSHNYSGSPGYGSSSARVAVSRGGSEIGSYNASAASGTSTQLLWRSVNLTIDASGNVTLAPVQQFATGSSGTVLRFLDGDEQLE